MSGRSTRKPVCVAARPATRAIAAAMALFLAAADPSLAQGASAPDAESIEAIAKLEFMLGSWAGTSTTMMGPGNESSSSVTERATLLAGGTVLLLEGHGTTTEGGDSRVVHEAVGIVTWNSASGVYDMRAFRAGQGWTDATLEVDGRRLRWGMETPGGTVRFTLDFGEDDRWHEVGEIERGGQWYTFLEMNLRRVR